MTDLHENVVDLDLRSWALPAFSTTANTNTTIGAVLLMPALQEYFVYRVFFLGCGIPRVTLLGFDLIICSSLCFVASFHGNGVPNASNPADNRAPGVT